LDPAAILRGDKSRQLLAVVVRGDRREAAAADREDARPLGLDASAGLSVVGGLYELFLTRADLQRQCAPARLRQQIVGLEPKAALTTEPEPVETCRGEHDGVQPALAALAQPRIDVAAKRLDRQFWLEREELRLAPDRRGTDTHSGPELCRAA